MASKINRRILRQIPNIFSDNAGFFFIKFWLRDLRKELEGRVTDKFIELLLMGLNLAFDLSKSFRKNIRNFEGRYLFRTTDNLVAASAIFKNGNMDVRDETIDDWDARISFKDAAALRDFIFSRDQDILDSILANTVEVDGNLNYVYKFGFMARDLSRRLGIQ